LPKFGKPVKYAYITGRVRAMKTKLVPAEMYARMMSMDMSEIAGTWKRPSIRMRSTRSPRITLVWS